MSIDLKTLCLLAMRFWAVPLMAALLTAAALAGCPLQDCAYYGGADASVRCVVVGPAPTGGGH